MTPVNPPSQNLVMNTQLRLKSVSEICSNKDRFYVPDYQRGYRWEKKQVRDLMNDLVEFSISKKSLYCLQPLVVVPKSDKGLEVVDGQQRLTTLFLILTNLLNPDREKPLTKEPEFKINYERREQELWDIIKKVRAGDQSRPDFHYLKQADDEINESLEKGSNRENLGELFLPSDNPSAVSFIWYQLEGHAIDTFTRLNAGKIPLTDVELIRALFLGANNGQNEAENLRIATVWDQMEKRLNEREFWSFASHNEYKPVNRIELIFRMASDKSSISDSNHTLYEYFREQLEDHGIRKSWEKLEHAFSTLEEWYDDHAVFHMIGFLSDQSKGHKNSVWELYQNHWKPNQGGTKAQFRKTLKDQIHKSLFNNDDIEDFVGDLEYKNNNRHKIKQLLLCFNLASLMTERTETVRFSFSAFREQNWDIEHIHALGTDPEIQGNELEDTLKMYLAYFINSGNCEDLQEELKEAIEQQKDRKTKQELYGKCQKALQESQEVYEEELNSICNLTLLDSGINRGYKNCSFKVKRSWILSTENQSIYIPPCTRNVFTKSYTPEPADLIRWDLEKDGRAYVKKIVEVLEKFFEETGSKEENRDRESNTPSPKETSPEKEDGSRQKETNTPYPTSNNTDIDGDSLSFLGIVEKYQRIEIPLIQRDYAQGRESVEPIREAFLSSLFDALEKNESLTLDFVYGASGNGDAFIPIDGQQRLTTLFLLHWFAFVKTGKVSDLQHKLFDENSSRFCYRVRPGAERFFPKLLEWDPPAEFLNDKSFQKHLREQNWFFRNWLNDPTVKGALVMLEAIKKKFNELPEDAQNDMVSRLEKIQMEVLHLRNTLSADELYLKMNSRGKELTGFEKFKAWLIDHHESFEMSIDGTPLNWKLKLDQCWLEFFWFYNQKKADAVSSCYFNTILALAINYQAGRNPNNKNLKKWLELDQSYRKDIWEELFNTKEAIQDVFMSLDAFYKSRPEDIEQWWELRKWLSSNDKKTLISNPDLKLSLLDRCWIHAITLHCRKKSYDDQEEWFRVARNLISNTALSNDTFSNTISSLNYLSSQLGNETLDSLAKLDVRQDQRWKPESFKDQLEEECQKAKLLTKDREDWKDIYDAEEHDFLRGQITVLLRNLANEEETVYADVFKKRWKIFESLMDRKKMNPAVSTYIRDKNENCLDRLVIRAILARCKDLETGKDIRLPRMAISDGGWGECLKRPTNDNDVKGYFQNALLSVLDEILTKRALEPEEFVGLLNGMVEQPRPTCSWMRNLIRHGEKLLKHSRSWRLRNTWKEGEMSYFLLAQTNRSYHKDILIGSEFNVRNKLIDLLVLKGWGLRNEECSIKSYEHKIYLGHHRVLTSNDNTLLICYKSLVVNEQNSNSISFMEKENNNKPRDLEEVLADLNKALT